MKISTFSLFIFLSAFSASAAVSIEYEVVATSYTNFKISRDHLPWHGWIEVGSRCTSWVGFQNSTLEYAQSHGKILNFSRLKTGDVIQIPSCGVDATYSESPQILKVVSVLLKESSTKSSAEMHALKAENAALLADRQRLQKYTQALEARVAQIDSDIRISYAKLENRLRELRANNTFLMQQNSELAAARASRPNERGSQ